MKIAVIGATGLVGQKIIDLIAERELIFDELIPAASERSLGRQVTFNGKQINVLSIRDALNKRPDIALFSAGASVSLEWAAAFTEQACYVVDNSSAWRMNEEVKLIVPEINASLLGKDDLLISNPNCSTIQMLMPLAPLHNQYGIRRIVVSTYQSVTGSGQKAIRQLLNERRDVHGYKKYPYQIDLNCLPHCDDFCEDAYTKEEHKLVNESRKILGAPGIGISATAVRVPVVGGHCESVNVEFRNSYELNEVIDILTETPGVQLMDDISKNIYPMPLLCEGKDDVFVGRIRRDPSRQNSLNLWIVADNLRKGAATNAVQIAEYLQKHII